MPSEDRHRPQGHSPDDRTAQPLLLDDPKPMSLPMRLRFESIGSGVSTTFDEDLCLRVLSEDPRMPGATPCFPRPLASSTSIALAVHTVLVGTLVERGALVTNGPRFTIAHAGRCSA